MYINKLNDIPFIGCINLLSRKDRYNHMVKEFKKLDILDNVNFLRVRKHKLGGKIGCYDSHLQLYRYCLENKYQYALIFEDDVSFNLNNNQKFIKSINFIFKSNPNWSIINCSNDFCKIKKKKKDIFNALSTNAHCYLISREAMIKSLNLGITDYHIDLVHALLFKFKNMYLIFPSPVNLKFFKSDNQISFIKNSKIIKNNFLNNIIKLYRKTLEARTEILVNLTTQFDYKKELITFHDTLMCDFKKSLNKMRNDILNAKLNIDLNNDKILKYNQSKKLNNRYSLKKNIKN